MDLSKASIFTFELCVLSTPILLKTCSIVFGGDVPGNFNKSFISSLVLRGRPSHDVAADRRLYVSLRFDMICGDRCPVVISVVLAALWTVAFAGFSLDGFPLPRPYVWCVVHLQILLLSLALHKHWMNSRTVHWWYAFLMLQSLIIHCRYAVSPWDFWLVSKVMVFARLGVSVMITDFRVHMIASLLHTLLCFGVFYVNQYQMSALAELPILCVVLVFGGICISGSWMTAVEIADADETKREMAATLELLRVVCDAVVEVDNQHVITNTATDLAALLLRGTDMSLEGTNFGSLLALDADRLMFVSRVGTSEIQVQNATASVMPVRIADSLGNLLRLDLLHVPFSAADGRLRHFIGIRESVDTLDEFRADAKCDKTRDRCRGKAVEPYQMTSDAPLSAQLASRPSVVGTMVFDVSNFELFFLQLRTGLVVDTTKPRSVTCRLQTLLPDCSTNDKFKSSLESYVACFLTAESTNQHPPASITDISIVLRSPHSCDGHHSAQEMFANCSISLHRTFFPVCRRKADTVDAMASCCDVDVGANQGNSSSNCSEDDRFHDRKSNGVQSSLIVAMACLWGGASPSGSFMETSETRSDGSSSVQESVSNTSGSASSNSDAEQVPAEALTSGRPRLNRRKRVERKRHSRRSSYEQILVARSAALFRHGDVESLRIDDKSDVTDTEGSQRVASAAIAETTYDREVAPSRWLCL